jgi:DNA-binding transcriptional ArsR family regulator
MYNKIFKSNNVNYYNMVKRKKGQRSGVLLDDVDIEILKILNKSKKPLSIGEVQDKLDMSHVSFKIHVRRLERLKIIIKKRVPKMFKFNLELTKEGEELLHLFNIFLKK